MSCALNLPPEGRHDRVVRLIVTHWILGAALGVACAALLLWLDVAGLRSLLWTRDRVVWEALVLLFGGFAITFGGVVCAGAVMTVPGGHDDPDGGLDAAGEAAFRASVRPVLLTRRRR
jgi:hypothetical protein